MRSSSDAARRCPLENGSTSAPLSPDQALYRAAVRPCSRVANVHIWPTVMAINPHDALFKAAFGHPEIARSELELVLPAAIRAQLDLAPLDVCAGSFVDEELRHSHTDLLYLAL